MISPTQLRELDAVPADTARPAYLSAASGLIRIGQTLYVIADDELHLGRFSLDDPGPGRLVRLVPGHLPSEPAARKRHKPDFESLALLPPQPGFPHGVIWALGSGSTPNRRKGVLLALDEHGEPFGQPIVHDLSALLAPLADAFGEVNIEGATIAGNELRLFQRGNNSRPENAIVSFALPTVLDLLAGRNSGVIASTSIRLVRLGDVGGVPLCFTDAASLPDGETLFSAVAEDTDNAYNDGACVGACVGIISRAGGVRTLEMLDHPLKVEGVAATPSGDRLELLLVTDADDADIPAALYAATIG